jgi:hypothetical protein
MIRAAAPPLAPATEDPVGAALAANTFQIRESGASRRDPIDRVQRGVQRSPLTGRFFQTDMESGLVPVGAGVVMGWVGLGLRGRRHPLWSPASLSMAGRRALGLRGLGLRGRRHDDIHKGPHPTSLPLPPLQVRFFALRIFG